MEFKAMVEVCRPLREQQSKVAAFLSFSSFFLRGKLPLIVLPLCSAYDNAGSGCGRRHFTVVITAGSSSYHYTRTPRPSDSTPELQQPHGTISR